MSIVVDGIKYIEEVKNTASNNTIKIGAINIKIVDGGVVIWHDQRYDQEQVEFRQNSNGWIDYTNKHGIKKTIWSV